MQFAYSTNAFKRFALAETIKLIRDIGFDGVEIIADRPHLYPPDYVNAGKLQLLKKQLDNLSLSVSNLNTFTLFAIGDMHHPSWIEKDPKLREERIEHTKQSLEIAAALGCPSISIQPGGKVEHFLPEKSMDIFIEGLQQVIPVAKHLGVKILVEPEPQLLMENSTDFSKFLPHVDTQVVGLNCDIGHFFCAGDDPADVIYKFADVIHHIHIEDIKGRVHDHKIPGHGDIDFGSVFEAIKRIKYGGFISVELYPYQENPAEAGRESLQFLKRFVL